MAIVGQQKSVKEILGFDDTIALLMGIPIISFFVPITFFQADLSEGIIAYLPMWGVSLMYTVSYWAICRFIIIYGRRKFSSYSQTRHRLVFSFLSITASFFVINFVLDTIQYSLNIEGHPPGVTTSDVHLGSFLIIALVSLLYESVFLYDRWKLSILETEKLRRENVESQLEGLKNQVNPHFLFNSLNTLAYIIPENPEQGVKFVQKLSKVYRYILEISDQKLIKLEEELNFLQAYNFLLKERFGENLEIRIEVPEEYRRQKIVPLSLQILFENAIKHNIISSEQPLLIELDIEGGKVCVKNNLQRKTQVMHSTGMGLQNIKNRYAYFTEEEVLVSTADAHFSVCLPLVKVSEALMVEQ
jgi:two-component system LytT family sensor kinase